MSTASNTTPYYGGSNLQNLISGATGSDAKATPIFKAKKKSVAAGPKSDFFKLFQHAQVEHEQAD